MDCAAFHEERNTKVETHFKLRSSTTFVQKLKMEKCHPMKWPDLSHRSIGMLIDKGPLKTLCHDFDFPKNSDNRIFLKEFFKRQVQKGLFKETDSVVLIASAAVLRLKKACKLLKEGKALLIQILRRKFVI
jgi:hypothetical protein